MGTGAFTAQLFHGNTFSDFLLPCPLGTYVGVQYLVLKDGTRTEQSIETKSTDFIQSLHIFLVRKFPPLVLSGIRKV